MYIQYKQVNLIFVIVRIRNARHGFEYVYGCMRVCFKAQLSHETTAFNRLLVHIIHQKSDLPTSIHTSSRLKSLLAIQSEKSVYVYEGMYIKYIMATSIY